VEFHRASWHRPVINMMNMVDVMLLLLIFFVITTTFIYRPAILVEPPESDHLAAVPTGTILVSVDAEGGLYLDGQPLSPFELRSQLAERVQTEQDNHVVIEADRKVPYGVVVQAVDTVVASGARRITLPTIMRSPPR